MSLLNSLIAGCKNTRIDNYAMPELTSYLLDEGPDGVKVRLFHAGRNHTLPITPHNHRFDLTSVVLQGEVTNILWTPNHAGDLFSLQRQTIRRMGEYTLQEERRARYSAERRTYKAGDTYHMAHSEIHSIEFARDTIVLLYESTPRTTDSYVLLPVLLSDGTTINTLETKPWMFSRGQQSVPMPPEPVPRPPVPPAEAW